MLTFTKKKKHAGGRPRNRFPTHVLTVRIPEVLYKRAQKQAIWKRMTVSKFIRFTIGRYIEEGIDEQR